MSISLNRNWIPLLLALSLIFPLFSLPRPVNVSSITWKVELLFSILSLIGAAIAFRSTEWTSKLTDTFRDPKLRPVVLSLGLFCAWSAASCIWANSPASAAHHTLVWGSFLIAFGGSFSLARNRRGKALIISLFCLLAVFLGGLATFDFATIQDFTVQEGTLRIRYAKFAEMLLTFAPVLFSAAILAKDKAKFAAAVFFGAAAWIGVMLSLSKGAFLAGSIGFMILFAALAFFKRGFMRKTIVAASVWFVVTVLFQFGISTLTSIPSTVNYISGERDTTRSTSDMRIYTWKVAAGMIASNFALGVGGDNFGIAFNEAREAFARAYPEDMGTAIGEDYVFERAHNEPLQIFAELGVFGFALFCLFVIFTGWTLLRSIIRSGRYLSPLFYGGLAGIAAFAVSSLLSSFSFRAFQNGVVFFIVLGLTLAISLRRSTETLFELRALSHAKLVKTLVIGLPALLLIFSLTKAASQYILLAGEGSGDLETAVGYFDAAASLDRDNPGAELASAEAYVREKRWPESIPHFKRSIEEGFGISVIYSYLANAQEMSGDLAAAELTLREAANVFPRSSFIRARLSIVLEKFGRQTESDEQMRIGRTFDRRQTNGWRAVIKDGILNAHLKAQRYPTDFAAPPELMPYNAIHTYNTDKVRVD